MWRNIYIAVMVPICSWSISMIFVICFQCAPLAHMWDDTIPGRCINLDPNVLLQNVAIGNIVTDVIIMLLPLPVVWQLKLSRDQENRADNGVRLRSYVGPPSLHLLRFSALPFRVPSFAAATNRTNNDRSTCVIAALRATNLAQKSDITYSFVAVVAWSTSELTSGILCASLPTLRPLFIQMFPSLFPKKNPGCVYDLARKHVYPVRGTKQLSRVVEPDEYPLRQVYPEEGRPYNVSTGSRGS